MMLDLNEFQYSFQYTAGAPKIRCSIFPKEPPWMMGFFLPTGLHQQSSNPRSSCVPTQAVQRLNPFQRATNDHIHQAAYPIQIWAAAWPILVRSNRPSSSPLNRSNPTDLGHDPPITAPVVKSAAEHGIHPVQGVQQQAAKQRQRPPSSQINGKSWQRDQTQPFPNLIGSSKDPGSMGHGSEQH
ncbi:hypothetical protein ACLOJK_023935, partial [Asimina triloba]